jgi:hypothetical protein
MGAVPQGSFGTAKAAEMYPMTKDSVLSLKRLRSYVQEKAGGATTSSPTLFNDGSGAFVIILFLMIVIGLGVKISNR